MTEYSYRKGYLAGEKRCIHCGADLRHGPETGPFRAKVARVAGTLNRIQARLSKTRPATLHVLLDKK